MYTLHNLVNGLVAMKRGFKGNGRTHHNYILNNAYKVACRRT